MMDKLAATSAGVDDLLAGGNLKDRLETAKADVDEYYQYQARIAEINARTAKITENVSGFMSMPELAPILSNPPDAPPPEQAEKIPAGIGRKLLKFSTEYLKTHACAEMLIADSHRDGDHVAGPANALLARELEAARAARDQIASDLGEANSSLAAARDQVANLEHSTQEQRDIISQLQDNLQKASQDRHHDKASLREAQDELATVSETVRTLKQELVDRAAESEMAKRESNDKPRLLEEEFAAVKESLVTAEEEHGILLSLLRSLSRAGGTLTDAEYLTFARVVQTDRATLADDDLAAAFWSLHIWDENSDRSTSTSRNPSFDMYDALSAGEFSASLAMQISVVTRALAEDHNIQHGVTQLVLLTAIRAILDVETATPASCICGLGIYQMPLLTRRWPELHIPDDTLDSVAQHLRSLVALPVVDVLGDGELPLSADRLDRTPFSLLSKRKSRFGFVVDPPRHCIIAVDRKRCRWSTTTEVTVEAPLGQQDLTIPFDDSDNAFQWLFFHWVR